MKTDLGKAFGKILRELREKKEMTQAGLSAISGIDRSYLSELESGKLNPSLSTILKISRALKVSSSTFMTALEEASSVKHQQLDGKKQSAHFYRELGKVLENIRKDAGMTLSTLAEKSNSHSSRILKIERGLNKVDFMTVYNIAKVLNHDLSAIIRLVEKKIDD